jgi:surface carbohydrate biosynthesis protein (TIGR04326 family)
MNQTTDKRPSFLIWDDEGTPPKGKWIPVLWRSYAGGDNPMHSIPSLVEEQADTLRSRFLACIYEIGDAQIKGKRLVDHLELRPGFSYWWMTLVAEKSNAYKSLQIIDVLKMLALEDLVGTYSASTIILKSGNKTLAQAFRLWCKKVGMAFEWIRTKQKGRQESWARRLYHSLSYPIQAFIWLAHYIWQRWPLKQQNVYKNAVDSAEMTFFDYLIHLNQKALTTGQFASNFWTDLVGALDHSGSKVNWLHLYIQHEALTSTKQARDLIARFNQSGTGRQFHTFLDGALSISVVVAALIDYSRLVWMHLRLNKIKRQFCPTGSRLDLWPLFRQDWRKSMLGLNAIWNCLVLNLFERTLRRLPHQKLGVYLQENQGWEMALIYAWRAVGHGRLIGVPHSTVRYWDLRYFFDPRNYQRTGKNDVPLPDKMALNGPAAMAAYREGGCPADQMVEVEALRYLYLADLPPMQSVASAPSSSSLSVLVLGDYLHAITLRQMQWLTDAAPLLPLDTRYIVKAHLSCPVKASDYPSLHLQITALPLAKLLSECDVAYSSNITSAAVDVYCTGLPVVSMLDSNSFNMSPLRGLEGIVYVTNPTELADALRNARSRERVVAEPYFCLNKGLPRWRKLLGMRPTGVTKSVET